MDTINCMKHIKVVVDFLSCTLQHSLINGGRDDPNLWSLRSLDITPLDTEAVKKIVYRAKMWDFDLKNRITDAIAAANLAKNCLLS